MSFRSDAEIIIESLESFYSLSSERRRGVVQQKPIGNIVATLDMERYVCEGGLEGAALAEFLKRYLATATTIYHPEFMSHQSPVPHHLGSLGRFIDAFTANATAIYEMGPSAICVEL